MECWDEDFSTIKGPPQFYQPRQRSLSSWKADIPIVDGDMTLKKNQTPPLNHDMSNDFLDEDGDEDFADEFESAMKTRKPQVHYADEMPDAFQSDSSSKSPGRASVSSAASASSTATSWDCDDDFGFDFDEDELPDPKADLAARFRSRQEKARAEANAEAAQLAANYASTVSKNRSPEKRYHQPMMDSDDDLLDMGLDQLTLRVKNGTVNKNIKLQPASGSIPHSPSKLLRGMRSIAQLPQKQSDTTQPPPPSRLRGAVSMFDLGRMSSQNQRPSSLHQQFQPQLHPPSQLQSQLQTPLQSQLQAQAQPQTVKQRPLTAYREPKTVTRPELRKQKSRKLNLIRNPTHTLKRQERNGMVLNPQTGLWEGNDVDASRFDLVDNTGNAVKPTLITKQNLDEQSISQSAAPNGMLFDNRTLSWIYANEEEYDDPFAEIDEGTPMSTPSPSPQLPSSSFTPSHSHSPSMQSLNSARYTPRLPQSRNSRKVTNESMASTTSYASTSNFGRASVARSETSGQEVFDVTPRMAAEWRHADERFMRKFGKWIGSDEEKADALQSDQHFYEMVKNA